MNLIRLLPSLHALKVGLRTTSFHELETHIRETCHHLDYVDSFIHAFLPDSSRLPRLLSSAAILHNRHPDPTSRPPLYGVLVGIKDIFATADLPTQAGSRLPPSTFASLPEAACVTKLKNAGALVLGKTATTEFAYFEPGPTRNPHDLDHTPGGSSSGSAAAVAAGLCVVALGTQTNGSIVRPAAYCGVVGFKPSYGRIEIDEGVIPCAPSVDTIGIFSRDVDGARTVASVLCRDWKSDSTDQHYDPNTKESPTERLPILGVPDGPYLCQTSPPTLARFESTLAILRRFGYNLIRIPLLPNIAALNTIQTTLVHAEMALSHRSWFCVHEELYRPRTRSAILAGRSISLPDLDRARNSRIELQRHVDSVMRMHEVDMWVCPSATGPAPRGLEYTGDPVMNLPWSHAGLPVVAVPAGRVAGLPVGVQLVGQYGTDEEVIRWAAGVEAVVGG
ncbi:amidase [Jimgerdemannia flammicorona]|uniref:Amidase n=1 Tax=Jimgerdemannia flammicorona TaxID=994334 RepID=A0A433CWP0_9FUNG|nr:amidase [Jimgerdemannia flammicorona]